MDQELQQDIVKMYHDHEMAGHPGELETYNGVRQHYWWPGLQTFVKNYIQGCQQFKINQSPSNPAYIAIEGANTMRTFARCSMDLITDLLPVEGYDSILVVVDQGLSNCALAQKQSCEKEQQCFYGIIFPKDLDYLTK
jgi:Integrase zinc binding domain